MNKLGLLGLSLGTQAFADNPQDTNKTAEGLMGLGVSGLWLTGVVVVLIALMFVPRLFSKNR